MENFIKGYLAHATGNLLNLTIKDSKVTVSDGNIRICTIEVQESELKTSRKVASEVLSYYNTPYRIFIGKNYKGGFTTLKEATEYAEWATKEYGILHIVH